MTLFSSFHFLHPWAFLLLLPAAALLVAHHRRSRGDRNWSPIMDPELLQALLIQPDAKQQSGPLIGFALSLLFSILALAGPAWKQIPSPFVEDQAPMVLVMKVTESMNQTDLAPSRLERSAHKIRDILEARAGARSGLMAYAGSAHSVMPLTRDGSVINFFAASLNSDIMPTPGDRPTLALAQARRMLGDAAGYGTVLLITDGIPPDEAAAMKKAGEGLNLLLLGATGSDPQAPERRELEKAARTLGVALQFITPDEEDVQWVKRSAQRRMQSSHDAQEGSRSRNEGYALLPFCLLLALLGFRRGWNPFGRSGV